MLVVDFRPRAVEHLHVELGEHEGLVHAGLAQVSLGGGVHHVPHLEAFHGLVLTAERREPGVCRKDGWWR